MNFLHANPDFSRLLAIVGAAHDLDEPLVEKDYWVTHALWALEQAGLELWFKGGTSLSKGFGIIQRFSEDLDLRLCPGRSGLPEVPRWKGGGSGAVAARRGFFQALEELPLPDLAVRLLWETLGKGAESAHLKLEYPGQRLAWLPAGISPFILLEAGEARVRPSLARPISSMIHDHVAEIGLLPEFTDNRPKHLACVHPVVTLVEKLDAILRRFAMADLDPVRFVRHYEDAAHIIQAIPSLPPMGGYPQVDDLIEEMFKGKQIRQLPDLSCLGLNPDASGRWEAIHRAHRAIQPMFWRPRLSLEEATAEIRGFLRGLGLAKP